MMILRPYADVFQKSVFSEGMKKKRVRIVQFLIDLENVHSAGLRGSELLTEEDTIVLFYSDSNEKIEQGALNRIFRSGCRILLRKLKTKGKNALDAQFWINTTDCDVV